MRFEQLHLFATILSCGSFAAAARLLHLSQPSITTSLSALEAEVGQRLLERTPGQRRPVRPTAAGEIFAGFARKALTDYRGMLSAVTLSSDAPQAPVRIGVTPTPGSSLLPVLTNKFREENPALTIQVKTFRGTELARRLKEGEFDLGVTGTRPQDDGIVFERFFYDPLVLIAPVRMGLTGPITLRELKRLPLVVRDASGNLMRLLIQALNRVGLSLERMNVVMQVSGNNDVLSSVTLGAGVGFVARSLLAANRENHDIMIVPVRRLQVTRYVYMLRRESSSFTGGMRLFWEYAMGTEWREHVFSYNTMML